MNSKNSITDPAPRLSEALRCPRCGGHLVNTQAQLQCRSQHHFPIIDGVPIFLNSPGSENERAIARLEKMNSVAGEKGWRAALELMSDDPDNIRYVTDEARASFLNLIPFDRRSTILEVGCSLGQITEHLCRRAGVVHAMDVVMEQVHFTQMRCTQSGLDNISVSCGGDDCLLPYPDDFFDCVIANLVLEWSGMRSTSSPLESQRMFLRECARVLKENGYLFVATKNRFSIRYLLGRPDEHAYEMRFGNALPRWLMKLWLRVSARPFPRSILFSFRGLKSELQIIGCSDIQAFWAIPNPRYPVDFVKFNRRSIREAKKRWNGPKRMSRATRVLFCLPKFLLPYFTEGLVFLAKK